MGTKVKKTAVTGDGLESTLIMFLLMDTVQQL